MGYFSSYLPGFVFKYKNPRNISVNTVTRGNRPQNKDKDRRKRKGHRFCLGGRIYSIPCLASCFALGDLNDMYDELRQDDLKEKDEFILFFKIVLGKIARVARNLINSFPQTEATTIACFSVFILCNRLTQKMWITLKTGLFLRCNVAGNPGYYTKYFMKYLVFLYIPCYIAKIWIIFWTVYVETNLLMFNEKKPCATVQMCLICLNIGSANIYRTFC